MMVSKDDCIFCKISRNEIPSKKVYDSENFFGILDIHPKAEGHTLIVSKQHYKNLLDMPVSSGCELLDAIKKVGLDLIKDKKGDAFNVVINLGEAAGQVVHHFHLHIIPRKNEDGLKIC